MDTAVGAPTVAVVPGVTGRHAQRRGADRPPVTRRLTQWLKRDFTPTWRYGFNLGPSLRHARSSSPLDAEDPYTRFLRHPQVAGVADAYCRMQLRIRDMNGWLNLASDRPASSSQLWHRDRPEDHSIVKVFVNLTDVGEGSGPLQYVRGSHRGRLRTESFEQSFDGIGHRISDADVERRFPPGARETGTGPVGTVIFADTRGLHRGGHATTRDRILLHGLYSSRSSVRHPILLPAEDVSRGALRDFALA